MTNLCVDCKHHKRTLFPSWYGVDHCRGEPILMQLCRHPDHITPPRVSHITGKNIWPEKLARCGSYNSDGKCQGFEAKE